MPTEGPLENSLYLITQGNAEVVFATHGMLRPSSVDAAVKNIKATAQQSLDSVANLKVQATAQPANTTPAATLTGPVEARVLNIGIPAGRDGMGYAEGQQLLAESLTAKGSAAQSAASAAQSLTLAQQAQAAAYAIPDDANEALIGNPATKTRQALDVGYGARGAGVARFLARARAGEDMTVGVLGDSIGQGYLLTNPETERWSSLTLADLSARHGITLTEVNQAVASYTSFRSFVGLKVDAVIAAQPDLVFIQAFDKNDLGSDQYGQYAPGFPLEQSTAAIERMIRLVREHCPQADIALISTNPYTSPQTDLNALQRAKDAAVRRLAAVYGCEWIDGYTAFTALGAYDHLIPDGTHPNAAGNRILADKVMEHFPNAARPTAPAAATPRLGYYHPEHVETTVSTPSGTAFGYMAAASPGTRYNGDFVWTETGAGWATVGSDNITSTPGNYAEFTFYGTELHPMIDTSNAAAAVLDITIDGVLVANDQPMNTGKNNGLNYVPVALGLTPGWHTVRLTLVSGKLSINTAYALAAPRADGAGSDVVVVTALSDTSVISLDIAGAWTTVASGTLTLPAGWGSAAVVLSGAVALRAIPTTTTRRLVQPDLLIGGVSVLLPAGAPLQQALYPTTEYMPATCPLSAATTITATTTVQVRARTISTDKDRAQSAGVGLSATLIRTS